MKSAVCLMLLVLSCASTEETILPKPPAFESGKKSINILFIGNSLTFYNELPELLKEIAAMDKTSVGFKSVVAPNYSLEDHWNEGMVQKEIATKKYDIVIGQQGPSALPESQVLLKQYSQKFAETCAKAGTSWGLYMVWPAGSRSFDLDDVIHSYTQAAKSTSGLLCPAGLAWKLAWLEDPALPLYGPDQFHPSMTGSVLAAMTIYAALQSKENFDFIDHGMVSWKNQISAQQLDLLKRSAISAVKSK